MSARLEQLLANATPGPWFVHHEVGADDSDINTVYYDDTTLGKAVAGPPIYQNADAALIALVPEGFRLLLDMGEALRLQHTQECGTGYCGNDLEHCERARSLLSRLDALGKGAA